MYIEFVVRKKKRDSYCCALGDLMSAAFFSQNNEDGEMTTQKNLQNNSNLIYNLVIGCVMCNVHFTFSFFFYLQLLVYNIM